MNTKVSFFWFRRDLRISDNHGLWQALKKGQPVLPVFIFDTNILKKLPPNDARITFLHQQILNLKKQLQALGSDLMVQNGTPQEIWKDLLNKYPTSNIFTNEDYESYAQERDASIETLCTKKGGTFQTFKDHVLFAKNEITKDDKKPYTIFTPYSRKWKSNITPADLEAFNTESFLHNFIKIPPEPTISLQNLGFSPSSIKVPEKEAPINILKTYHQTRDIPSLTKGTSRLGIHLRFGTISIRALAKEAQKYNETFLNELIWRDFYQQILWHFPHVETKSFRPAYDQITWRNDIKEFQKWCEGKTGFPIVDAGMRELNQTGYMHNRVRMITASFLCKDLLIDWRWGEHYFAERLLDYDKAANNGGWQWAAGTGCDAAPYFRVFNPESQQQKFDPDFLYIKKWVPEFGTPNYPIAMVDHKIARIRAIETYKQALQEKK